jgi:hypothetical protein
LYESGYLALELVERLVMFQARGAALTIVLLFSTFFLLPTTIADMPPPMTIYMTQTESGGFYSLATNVTLPEALVNVTIDLTDSWRYHVNVTCDFIVNSQTDQNLTTAFVYPSYWISATVDKFQIWVNETLTNYSILHVDEFKDKYDLNQTDWSYVRDCDFALFNFTIRSENPVIVHVLSEFDSYSTADEFIFEYIVETARGWEGNTHEIVQLQFNRHVGTNITKYWYSPEEYASFSGSEYAAQVIWDFYIQDFDYGRVSFSVQQRELSNNNDGYVPLPTRFLVFAMGVSAVFVIVGFFYMRRGFGPIKGSQGSLAGF